MTRAKLPSIAKFGEQIKRKAYDNFNHVFTDKIGEALHSACFLASRKKDIERENRKLRLANIEASKNDTKNFKEKFG